MGFGDILDYDYPFDVWPWTRYLIYGLLLGVPLLVAVSKPIQVLGAVRLTVYTGFLIVSSRFLLNLLYGLDWFGMYIRLGTGMWRPLGVPSWMNAIEAWLSYSEWVTLRLFIYIALGYLLVRHKGLLLGMAISIFISLIESTLGWLVLLPDHTVFEAAPFSIALQYEWDSILRAILVQVGILTLFAIIGGLLTRIRWRRSYRPRLVTATVTRYRPTGQISHNGGSDLA